MAFTDEYLAGFNQLELTLLHKLLLTPTPYLGLLQATLQQPLSNPMTFNTQLYAVFRIIFHLFKPNFSMYTKLLKARENTPVHMSPRDMWAMNKYKYSNSGY